MPAVLVYTNPLQPGICQMPVFSVGDATSWTLQFNNGNALYDPTGVSMNLGYVNGLENISYPQSFQWVDRMNNRHTASFAVAAGVPGSLTFDDTPIFVGGGNGAWLLRGRIPPSTQIRKVYLDSTGVGFAQPPAVGFDTGGGPGSGAAATAVIEGRDGGIQSISVTNQGSLYTSAPGVFIVPNVAGSGAAATAIIANGFVVLIIVTNPGVGYYGGAIVGFSGGGGSGAAATAGLFSNMITSALITNGGSGYTSAPQIAISGGGGSGALITCTINNGAVTLVAVGNPGSGYSPGARYQLAFSGGGGGAGAAAYITADAYNLTSSGTFSGNLVTLVSGGNGYTAAPSVSVVPVGGSGAAATAAYTASGGLVITVTNNGSGYTNPPLVAISGGGGGTGYAHAVVGGGVVQTIVIDSAGGFLSNPSVNITNSLGANAVTLGAQCSWSGYGSVLPNAATSNGGMFTTYPTVTLVGGGGTGATAIARCAIIGGTGSIQLTGLVVTNPGSGYTTAPSVVFSGLGTVGSLGPPAATVAIANECVSYVAVVQGGSSYPAESTIPLIFTGSWYGQPAGFAVTDSTGRIVLALITSNGAYVSAPPAVTVSSSGSGAVMIAVMTNAGPFGSLAGVQVVYPGSGYTSPPTLTLTGGGGSLGAITAIPCCNIITQVNVTNAGLGYTALPGVTLTPGIYGASAEASGVSFGLQPWIRNPLTFELEQSVTATPYWEGREDVSGNQMFDSSLLMIRPRIMLTPALVLQSDGVTYDATFDPSSLAFVRAVLRYRRSVTVDVHIYGAGRLLYIGQLTILNALQVTP